MSHKKSSHVIVALGTNLGSREIHLRNALCELEYFGDLDISPCYETRPLSREGIVASAQANYINMAVGFWTSLPPLSILEYLLSIEKRLGRERPENICWAPRTIDLDLIAVDDIVINTERLILPHEHMHQRDFVLKPLMDLWLDWVHPVLHKTAATLLEELEIRTLVEDRQ